MSLSRVAVATIMTCVALSASAEHHEAIADAIGNPSRAESNRERDGARKPSEVLAFMGLESGDAVLDYGAGGGYWAELFSSIVGDDGKV